MNNNRTLQSAAALAVIAGGYLYLTRGDGETSTPPTMEKLGETVDKGVLVTKKTVDWRAVVSSALVDKATFGTMTHMETMVRNRRVTNSVNYTPISSSALVQVTYNAEYPIGYKLEPGAFSVSGGDEGLVITLRRPELTGRTSVKLLGWKILDSGFFVDEQDVLLHLQQRIQPEAEKRAAAILARPEVIPRSEAKLRAFLQPLLQQQAGSAAPPPIRFAYR